mmetsp:Transcript_487/g.1248  ORF Transcript_487/g.1248 Transcript_487/m.1248 type:complete len:308 (-) Transcript_487:296-1219(-)
MAGAQDTQHADPHARSFVRCSSAAHHPPRPTPDAAPCGMKGGMNGGWWGGGSRNAGGGGAAACASEKGPAPASKPGSPPTPMPPFMLMPPIPPRPMPPAPASPAEAMLAAIMGFRLGRAMPPNGAPQGLLMLPMLPTPPAAMPSGPMLPMRPALAAAIVAALAGGSMGQRTMVKRRNTDSQPSVLVVSTVTNLGSSRTSQHRARRRARADTTAVMATCMALPPAVMRMAPSRSLTSLVMMLDTTLGLLCAVTLTGRLPTSGSSGICGSLYTSNAISAFSVSAPSPAPSSTSSSSPYPLPPLPSLLSP